MPHTESLFRTPDGLALFRQTWLPESDPSAVVALVHGVGEHSDRYMKVVGPLVEDGYAVCAYDQRGHGRSPGARVHIDSWAQYREDLSAFLGTVADELPGLPTVIYGHSMGSLVVLDYLLRQPEGLAGAVISGVAIEPAGVGSPVKIALARLLTGVVPRMTVDLGIDARTLSHDAAALEEFRTDSMVTGRATVRWATESLDAVVRVKEGMARIDLPVMVIHGQDDQLNRVQGAKALFDALPNPDKVLRVYAATYHEPHNDPVHGQVAADIGQWVAHLTRGTGMGGATFSTAESPIA